MSFEVLHRSPEVAPLLVRLYDTHNLYSLAEKKDNHEACYELSAIMVDLLSVRLNDNESELITDVLLALMKKAEKDMRMALSHRLAGMENIPLRMVLSLANDEISVADPVLRKSPVLQDLDLMYILQAQGVEHSRAVALREGLSPAIVDMLIDTNDFQVAVNLAGNNGTALTHYAYEMIAEMAKDHGTLADSIVRRPQLPEDIAEKLYGFVAAELKNLLTERFGHLQPAVNEAIDSIVAEWSEDALAEDHHVPQTVLQQVEREHKWGVVKVSTMVNSLRCGLMSTFIAQFSIHAGLPHNAVRDVLMQESGRKLAIVCRALDISKTDFVSIYLLSERFRSGGKTVVGPSKLTALMTMFETIDREDARAVLNKVRH